MKIKRFEASGMSEALRMIKKEFGEEAVILSAKTMKKSSLLSKKKGSKRVVVTAAIDNPQDNGINTTDGDETQLSSEGKLDGASGKLTGMNLFRNYTPITRTGRQKLKPKFVQMMSASQKDQRPQIILQRLTDQDVSDPIAMDFEEKISAIVPKGRISDEELQSALSQVIEAKELVKTSQRGSGNRPHIIIMVGPSGAGKTSAVAKLAARYAMAKPDAVALMSLDDQRIAGTDELERYARILGIQLEKVSEPKQIVKTLKKLDRYDFVVVDTPGVAFGDHVRFEQLRRMLEGMNGADIHLVLNATCQNRALEKMINFFSPLGVNRLLFTNLDWAVSIGPLISLTVQYEIALTYLSNSFQVPEGLQTATAHSLAEMLISNNCNATSRLPDLNSVTVVKKAKPTDEGLYYVANRNSDIFHHNGCNAVKRINTDNMVVFKDPAEAMDQQFKPCRMCCSELLISKPIDRLARRYASNRC